MRVRRVRFGCVLLLLAGLLAGCGGSSNGNGGGTEADPRGSSRRKEMEDFMKTNKSDGAAQPTNKGPAHP